MSDSTKAVFLSYASQDAAAARRICETLRAVGIEVWFDQSELRGGDEWDGRIRKQIRECALFVPVISANTEARLEGYFRLEWKLAEDRSHLMAKGKPFIVPVTIDETTERDAHVPDAFLAVQWTRLAGGENAAAFAGRVRSLLGMGVAQASPPAVRSEAGGTPALPQPVGRAPRARHMGAVAAVAVATVALVVGWWIWRPASPAAPISEPAARRSAPPTAEKAPAINDKSLVVLPLENLSPDPENAFFTDGMHSEIIATLQRLADLKVISRSSALEFKSTAPLREVAEKLGVAHAISGSVRRGNRQVRIQLELRRTRDEALVWTQTYNKELSDVLTIQGEIATDVARVLQVRERKGWAGGAELMTNSSQALDLFLKANQRLVDRGLQGGFDEPMAWLEEALRRDPRFVSAASLLSTYHNVQFRSKRDPRQRAYHATEAKRWGETASRLVPGGAGDGGLAAYYYQVAGDPARGVALAENNVRALPNDSEAINRRGVALRRFGRAKEAAAAFGDALTFDPLNPLTRANQLNAFATLRRTKEFDAAFAELRLRWGERPSDPAIVMSRYMISGRLPESVDGLSVYEKILWLGRARRSAEQLVLIQGELGSPKLTDADEFALRIEESAALIRMGRKSEAVEASGKALALAEKLQIESEIDPPEKDRRLAAALMIVGRIDEGIAAQRRVVEAYSSVTRPLDRWLAEITLARLFGSVGRARECVETLVPLLRVPSGITVPMLRVDPIWDNVRDDPGFKALLADPKNSAPL